MFKKYLTAQNLIILVVLVITFVAHSYNMFNYPAYFDDEGTYMSQAWSVLNLGELAPYTFWYDHAPVGWFIIAGWVKLIGGFYTFGTPINTGRVLMLLLKVLSTFFLYKISFKITKNNFISFVVSVIFALSPLAVSLYRMVFLDNLMVALLLASIHLLINKKNSLIYIYLSAIVFGLAILTKETSLFFLPAYVYLLLKVSKVRLFGSVNWLAIVFLVVSLYPLYALINGEFFPPNTVFGGTTDHVSLLETLRWQSSREGGFFLSSESEFMYMLKNSWLVMDPLLMVLGAFATVYSLVLGIKEKKYFLCAILSFSYLLYLIRGGIVNDQYIIPLIPLFLLNISVLLMSVSRVFKKFKLGVLTPLPSIIVLMVFSSFYFKNTVLYVKNNTQNQVRAVEWINENIEDGQVIAVDAYSLVEFFDANNVTNLYSFNGPHHYWKIEKDIDIRGKVINNNWKNIDYIMVTSKVNSDIHEGDMPLLRKTLENSSSYISFHPNEYNPNIADASRQITIADPGIIRIYKLNSKESLQLNESWEYYKENFMSLTGQIIDPQLNRTTSEGQSYAMLRAVWQDDKETFDVVWNWTQDHLQHRLNDNLLSRNWNASEDRLEDYKTAADADTDISLALLFAYKRWGEDHYREEALEIINDIWEEEVVEINGRYYIKSGADANLYPGYLVNPSYIHPAAYKVFAEVDSEHNWEKLADDSYTFLSDVTQQYNSSLIPNWVYLSETGYISSASSYVDNSAVYGYDAFKTYFRVGLDALWFKDDRAVDFIQRAAPFYEEQLHEDYISAEYDMNGNPISNYQSLSTLAAPSAIFKVTGNTNLSVVSGVFDKEYTVETANIDHMGYWGDKNNYYVQNWAWFSTAFGNNLLPNLWGSTSTNEVN